MKVSRYLVLLFPLGFLSKVISAQAAEQIAHGVRNDLPRPYSTQ